ncbi:hypothetical protein Bbelb_344400 [Branchiostoma belcheri]|nr:hypothetical protein Bbelb_344400 [Branchiostoma belcheri]
MDGSWNRPWDSHPEMYSYNEIGTSYGHADRHDVYSAPRSSEFENTYRFNVYQPRRILPNNYYYHSVEGQGNWSARNWGAHFEDVGSARPVAGPLGQNNSLVNTAGQERNSFHRIEIDEWLNEDKNRDKNWNQNYMNRVCRDSWNSVSNNKELVGKRENMLEIHLAVCKALEILPVIDNRNSRRRLTETITRNGQRRTYHKKKKKSGVENVSSNGGTQISRVPNFPGFLVPLMKDTKVMN